jgi:hypothetical protein
VYTWSQIAAFNTLDVEFFSKPANAYSPVSSHTRLYWRAGMWALQHNGFHISGTVPKQKKTTSCLKVYEPGIGTLTGSTSGGKMQTLEPTFSRT